MGIKNNLCARRNGSIIAPIPDSLISRKFIGNHTDSASLAKHPRSKGYSGNSFYSGLTPTQFLFNAISRDGSLVDTMVKTTQTRHMLRPMNSLEDLFASGDYTILRPSSGDIRLEYDGGDTLNSVPLEEKNALRVNFNEAFYHSDIVLRYFSQCCTKLRHTT